jgi:transposase
MGRPSKHSPEVRERAIRMVFDHTSEHPSQWAAIRSVGEKLGIRTESWRRWVRQAERDTDQRPGLTSRERDELKRLQRENVELRRANEILRKASAFFAQAELDRRPK